ncbi:MAG: RNA polymerase factor sigma-54 [Desulfitobacteriia bacterium]
MANNVGLFLEQSQRLIISPQMYQAIEMIQLSLPELVDYINNELVENPLLEVVEEYEEPSEEDRQREDQLLSLKEKEDRWLDSIMEEVINDGERDQWSAGSTPQSEFTPLEGCWFDGGNLQEYLLEQLRFIKRSAGFSEKTYQAAEYIIGNLDSNGYLTTSVEEIAEALKLSATEVLEALAIVQKLDPPGVGARNLKECLQLQFHLIPDCPPKLAEILDYLDDLAAGHLKKIASALNITTSEVRTLSDLLRLLDPKPGSRFDQNTDIKYIIPDAVIKKVGDSYVVLVNESDIPRISINESYKRALQSQDDQAIKKFLREKVSSALNLLKSIEQRRSTIHDVLEAIIARQRDFLEEGVSALKPLTMKEIAEELGLHESTVSRVSANKYVQTPRGICPIKCFFAGSIGKENDVTAERIKEELKKIIAEEDPQKPYSDQELASIFQKKGIKIARRTIAKYREELWIPSSSLRKKASRE